MKTKMLVMVLLIGSLLIGGCNASSKLDCANTGRQLTFGTNVCTVAVLAHAVKPAEAVVMNTTVHVAHNCWKVWRISFKDGNVPPPDVITCATSAIFDFLFWRDEYNITPESLAKLRSEDSSVPLLDVRRPEPLKDVNDEILDQVEAAYDLAVARFDSAFTSYFPVGSD